MRVLVTTAMYPSPERPFWGTFIRTQVESLRQAGIDVAVYVIEGERRKLAYARALRDVGRRVRRERFDLVHAHYGLVGIASRLQRQVPLVVTFHGDDVLGTVGTDGHHTRGSAVITRSSRVLARLADGVIVQTQQMATRLRRPDAAVVPHEVDLETFRPFDRTTARAELGLDPDRRYLLFASPPQTPVKRFPLARQVAERVSAGDRTVELCVVHTETQERLARYMSACDALLLTSYQEGSPNIVKQAMACNLPIVATDVGDVREVIGATIGCHVCAPDPEEMATRMREVLARGGRTQGRDAVRHLDCDSVARRVIGVYEAALSGVR